jgi:hypothetical protein
MAKAFRDWTAWFEDRTPIDRASRVNESFINNELDFRQVTRGGRYNAVLCMLAKNGAKDFFKGRIIDTGDYVDEKINDHHIFPSKVDGLDPATSQHFPKLSDSILNRTLLLDSTNKHKISNKKPSTYLLEMLDEGSVSREAEMQDLLADHLISPAAMECMLNDDFDGFIEARERTLLAHIGDLVGVAEIEA